MRWDEYVEEATAGIASRQQARDVRRELRDHLESATEELVATGTTRDDAEEEALRRLGPVDILRTQFRVQYRPWSPIWPAPVALGGVVAALICIGLQNNSRAVFLLAWSMVWAALHPRSFISLWRQPWPMFSTDELMDRLHLALPFAGAGLATAVFTMILGPVGGAFEPLAIVIYLGAAVSAWYVAVHLVGSEAEDILFPFGSGLATVTLMAALAVPLMYVGRLSDLMVIGAVYFAGTNALWWLRLQRQRSTFDERITLAVIEREK